MEPAVAPIAHRVRARLHDLGHPRRGLQQQRRRIERVCADRAQVGALIELHAVEPAAGAPSAAARGMHYFAAELIAVENKAPRPGARLEAAEIAESVDRHRAHRQTPDERQLGRDNRRAVLEVVHAAERRPQRGKRIGRVDAAQLPVKKVVARIETEGPQAQRVGRAVLRVVERVARGKLHRVAQDKVELAGREVFVRRAGCLVDELGRTVAEVPAVGQRVQVQIGFDRLGHVDIAVGQAPEPGFRCRRHGADGAREPLAQSFVIDEKECFVLCDRSAEQPSKVVAPQRRDAADGASKKFLRRARCCESTRRGCREVGSRRNARRR